MLCLYRPKIVQASTNRLTKNLIIDCGLARLSMYGRTTSQHATNVTHLSQPRTSQPIYLFRKEPFTTSPTRPTHAPGLLCCCVLPDTVYLGERCMVDHHLSLGVTWECLPTFALYGEGACDSRVCLFPVCLSVCR